MVSLRQLSFLLGVNSGVLWSGKDENHQLETECQKDEWRAVDDMLPANSVFVSKASSILLRCSFLISPLLYFIVNTVLVFLEVWVPILHHVAGSSAGTCTLATDLCSGVTDTGRIRVHVLPLPVRVLPNSLYVVIKCLLRSITRAIWPVHSRFNFSVCATDLCCLCRISVFSGNVLTRLLSFSSNNTSSLLWNFTCY